MSLADIANKALKSEIRGLVLDNTVIGFRVKCYDVKTDNYMYFDFDADIVRNIPELYQFFKDNIKSFNTSRLIRKNGMLYTSEELRGIYNSKELVSADDTVRVLRPVILLYKRGYLNV